MNYAHVRLSTGEILTVAPLPKRLIGLEQASLNSIPAAIDPCPDEFVDRGFLNRAGLSESQVATLSGDQLASLAS